MEDISSSSGTRLRGPSSTGRLPAANVPSSPTQAISNRRLDSHQELHGTANTVVIGFQPKRRFTYVLVALFAALAVIGLGLVGVVYMRGRVAPVSVDEPQLAVEPPSAVDPTLASPVTLEVVPPPAPVAGSVIGASPMPPTDIPAVSPSVASKPGVTRPTAPTHNQPGVTPRGPVPKPPAPAAGGKPAGRPLGLPDTRQ